MNKRNSKCIFWFVWIVSLSLVALYLFVPWTRNWLFPSSATILGFIAIALGIRAFDLEDSPNPFWMAVPALVGSLIVVMLVVQWGLVQLGLGWLFTVDNRPVLSGIEVPVDLELSSISFQPGEKGIAVLALQNKTDFNLVISSIEIRFPQSFFDGFIVDYENLGNGFAFTTEQQWNGLTSVEVTVIVINNIELESLETKIFELPFIANLPGDFSGGWSVEFSVGATSEAQAIQKGEGDLRAVVLPRN